ncbi:hypothetical protein LPTSP1_12750 [Leptospira johnsonii]|uniref:Uncharacterized protein n=1 Tax=Leptospira johnsonii TaxID=1917820 RepID=A0A2P2D0W0_9LEPT|nr:hypothetical protein LPTSP1_12750 [Leptospira johnsonii]
MSGLPHRLFYFREFCWRRMLELQRSFEADPTQILGGGGGLVGEATPLYHRIAKFTTKNRGEICRSSYMTDLD